MYQKINRTRAREILAVFSILVIGVSVALFKTAMFGIDPFQCFMSGMGNVLSFLPFGVMYTLVSVLQFIAMWFWGRKYIGFATFVNILFLGTIIEYAQKGLAFCFPDPSMAQRGMIFAVGIVLLCFSSATYFTADKGVSTYDFVALVMADKKIMSFRFCRIFTDSVCVIVGIVCGIGFGANVGVGTILTAFCMGPVIALFRTKVSDPFIARFPEEITSVG